MYFSPSFEILFSFSVAFIFTFIWIKSNLCCNNLHKHRIYKVNKILDYKYDIIIFQSLLYIALFLVDINILCANFLINFNFELFVCKIPKSK